MDMVITGHHMVLEDTTEESLRHLTMDIMLLILNHLEGSTMEDGEAGLLVSIIVAEVENDKMEVEETMTPIIMMIGGAIGGGVGVEAMEDQEA